MTNLTTADYLAMIENATFSDCARLAAESHDISMDVTEAELAAELYDFVLGDNESDRAFAIFKEAIDDAMTDEAVSKRQEYIAAQESNL